MTFSYSGDPSGSDVDEVRFLIQDTDSSDPLLSDEEIQYVIDAQTTVYGSNIYAAATCAERIAARFAREVTTSGDGVSISLSQLQDKYNALAASLRDEFKAMTGAGGGPYAGGTLFDDYPSGTLKPLSFGKGMHDNIRAGAQDFGGVAPQFYPETLPDGTR